MKKFLVLLLTVSLLLGMMTVPAGAAQPVYKLTLAADGTISMTDDDDHPIDISGQFTLDNASGIQVFNQCSTCNTFTLVAPGDGDGAYANYNDTDILDLAEGNTYTIQVVRVNNYVTVYLDAVEATASINHFMAGCCPTNLTFTVSRYDKKGTWEADMLVGGYFTLGVDGTDFYFTGSSQSPIFGSVSVINSGAALKVTPNADAIALLNSMPAGEYYFYFTGDDVATVNGESIYDDFEVKLTVQPAPTPSTGDNTPILLLSGLVLMSGAALFLLSRKRRMN